MSNKPLGLSFLYLKGSYDWLSEQLVVGDNLIEATIQLKGAVVQFDTSLGESLLDSIPKLTYNKLGKELVFSSLELINQAHARLSSQLETLV
jgi:hypothetical protein